MDAATLNAQAKYFRSLHQPGNPILMVNVWDAGSATIAATDPSVKAITTASFAIAAQHGVADNDLSFNLNIRAASAIAGWVRRTNVAMPVAADMQDGYADVAGTIRAAIEAGIVGANIEDLDNETGEVRGVEESVERVRTAVQAARDAGVPDFVVNARTDVMGAGGTIEEAIERGKRYLNAGAVTIYIWGGPKKRGLSTEEVKQLVGGLGGMINVKMNLQPGFLNAAELAEIGVARISVGPELYHQAMNGFRTALGRMLTRESFT